jgi:hypothetical protein
MNTARIVVLTVAIGTGGIAAYPAGGSYSPAPQSGMLSLALRSIADVNAKDDHADEPARTRGESVSVIRFSIPSQMTAQK